MPNCLSHAAPQAALTPSHPAVDAAAGWPSHLNFNAVRRLMARRNRVSADHLQYIGSQDESATVGKRIHLFNITDPSHWRYRSTVSFVEVVR